MLEGRIKKAVRDVPDFPRKGILFKDITPILLDYKLCEEIISEFYNRVKDWNIDAVVGIESRGFLFGPLLAIKLKVPFVPIRKKGKLPYTTLSIAYELEYGSSELEMHIDAVQPGANVLIHDDLLATGGTVAAAAQLLNKAGATISGYSFLIELTDLQGKDALSKYSEKLSSLVKY
jgi:adenine phosphoribosyltransferase